MKILKSKKGITLITLIIYMILTLMVISMLTLITTNFRRNINNVNSQTIIENKFDNLNLQLLTESKKENNAIAVITETSVEFLDGNIYEYDSNDKIIYQKNVEGTLAIKIIDGVANASFVKKNENNREILEVSVVIEGKKRTKEYVMTSIIDEEEDEDI